MITPGVAVAMATRESGLYFRLPCDLIHADISLTREGDCLLVRVGNTNLINCIGTYARLPFTMHPPESLLM